MPDSSRGRPECTNYNPDLAEIDADAERGLDRLLAPAGRRDLDRVGAGIFVELVEFEIAVVVGWSSRRPSGRP